MKFKKSLFLNEKYTQNLHYVTFQIVYNHYTILVHITVSTKFSNSNMCTDNLQEDSILSQKLLLKLNILNLPQRK